jgi:hypothetical protein
MAVDVDVRQPEWHEDQHRAGDQTDDRAHLPRHHQRGEDHVALFPEHDSCRRDTAGRQGTITRDQYVGAEGERHRQRVLPEHHRVPEQRRGEDGRRGHRQVIAIEQQRQQQHRRQRPQNRQHEETPLAEQLVEGEGRERERR